MKNKRKRIKRIITSTTFYKETKNNEYIPSQNAIMASKDNIFRNSTRHFENMLSIFNPIK